MGTNVPSISEKRGSLLGILALLFGVITAASVAMIGIVSFTSVNPPDWLRIICMAPLPFAVVLATGFGIAGVKKHSGYPGAVTGLVFTGLSIIAFVVMIIVWS